MRYVCPKDVKDMLSQRARTVYWKKWAAKRKNEELKEGVWLEPALALLRKKTKRDYESECQACHKEKGTEKAQIIILPSMARDQKGYPRGFQKVGAKSENIEGGVEVAKRYCRASSQ